VEPLFHPEQLLDFPFHQAADRDLRPAAHDLGDIFLVHFFFEHATRLLHLGEARFFLLEPPLELGKLAVLQL
jgi:hypothetical protein